MSLRFTKLGVSPVGIIGRWSIVPGSKEKVKKNLAETCIIFLAFGSFFKSIKYRFWAKSFFFFQYVFRAMLAETFAAHSQCLNRNMNWHLNKTVNLSNVSFIIFRSSLTLLTFNDEISPQGDL